MTGLQDAVLFLIWGSVGLLLLSAIAVVFED